MSHHAANCLQLPMQPSKTGLADLHVPRDQGQVQNAGRRDYDAIERVVAHSYASVGNCPEVTY